MRIASLRELFYYSKAGGFCQGVFMADGGGELAGFGSFGGQLWWIGVNFPCKTADFCRKTGNFGAQVEESGYVPFCVGVHILLRGKILYPGQKNHV